MNDFFRCLNFAYKNNQKTFEYEVTTWEAKKESDDFCRLHRCLSYYYKLKTDLKRKGNEPKYTDRDEYLVVDLSKVDVCKLKGFVFKEQAPIKRKEEKRTQQPLITPKAYYGSTAVSLYSVSQDVQENIVNNENNVIEVCFETKRVKNR